MHAQLSGPIGPFLDSVQQRQVPVDVLASCTYAAMASGMSPGQMEQAIQVELLRAIRDVISPKMASGQLAFKDLGMGNTAAIIPEIIAASGLGQRGIAVGKLAMSFGIDGRSPPPLPSAAPVATPQVAPQQAHVRVGGFNINASSDGGIDTAGIKNQLIDRAKSTILWWLFGIGAVVVVLLALGGYGYYAWHNTPKPPAAAAAGKPPPPAPPAHAPPGKK